LYLLEELVTAYPALIQEFSLLDPLAWRLLLLLLLTY
jgi:hypothetical protein